MLWSNDAYIKHIAILPAVYKNIARQTLDLTNTITTYIKDTQSINFKIIQFIRTERSFILNSFILKSCFTLLFQALFASCIPEIIDLIGTRPKYGGAYKNERGRRQEFLQIVCTLFTTII